MSDWLHALPVVWMALVVFGLTYLVAAAIYAAVVSLAARGYARSFKAVSPGMLPPLGIVFGLFVAFTAAQIMERQRTRRGGRQPRGRRAPDRDRAVGRVRRGTGRPIAPPDPAAHQGNR